MVENSTLTTNIGSGLSPDPIDIRSVHNTDCVYLTCKTLVPCDDTQALQPGNGQHFINSQTKYPYLYALYSGCFRLSLTPMPKMAKNILNGLSCPKSNDSCSAARGIRISDLSRFPWKYPVFLVQHTAAFGLISGA